MPCPNKDFCPAKVKVEHYKEYCLSDDKWKECKFYRPYEMTPAQWSKFIGEDVKKSDSGKLNLF